MRKMDLNFEELVKAELRYPDEWDTVMYSSVWEALWESYSWLKAKVELLERRIEQIESNEDKASYHYEQVPIVCERCHTRCFAIVKFSERSNVRKIIRCVCPVHERFLHHALRGLRSQKRKEGHPQERKRDRYLVFWLPQDFTNCIVVDADSEDEACVKALKQLGLTSDAKSLLHVVNFKDLKPGWRLWR